MIINEKIKLLANTLEVDENKLNAETVLSSLDEWDSMGKLLLIAMFEKLYHKRLSLELISNFQSIQNILDLME